MTVEQAQLDIAKILAAVEKETGRLVEEVCLVPIDIRSFDDKQPVHQMQVEIFFVAPLPTHQW